MNKKEVIERIKEEIGPECDDEMAEFIFKKALENKEIIIKFNWEAIVDRTIIAAVIVAAIWALIRNV
jgi:uncharacterized protein YdhG (YjbR/CyaY superfamily)